MVNPTVFLDVALISAGCDKGVVGECSDRDHFALVFKRILNADAERISVRLSDGLNALADKEADCVIISGMGGALILRILQDAGSLLYTMKTLVLSPQSEAEKVRGWLYERGFGFLDEEMVEEEGIYYPIMKIAVPTASDRIKPRYSADVRLVSMISGSGSRTHLSEAERYYGPCLLRKRSPVLYRYLNREKRIALRVLGQLKEAAGTRGETRKAQVKDDLERIECALAYYTGEQSKGRNYGMEGNSKMIVFDVRGEVQRLPEPVTFADLRTWPAVSATVIRMRSFWRWKTVGSESFTMRSATARMSIF